MGSIRVAEARDAGAIAHVHVESWRTTYEGVVPQEYLDSLSEAARAMVWQDWLTRDISMFVAEVDGAVVGFAGGGPNREPLAGYDAELYTIYLLREVQGQGIGRDLLHTVAKALVGKGHRGMLAWVLERNPAVGFYEKTGARCLMKKQIEIGGASLTEIAMGWGDLRGLMV